MLTASHNGASDGTGSSAGHILGTLHGLAWLPLTCLRPFKLVPEIECLAADLAGIVTALANAIAMRDTYPLP